MTSLNGMNVLVTRPGEPGKELCERINMLGGHAIYFPTIAFGPPKDEATFYQKLQALNEQDWAIFVSQQAIYETMHALAAKKMTFPQHLKLATIGKSSALALRRYTHQPVLFPENKWTTEGLLNLPAFQSVVDWRIAIIRGEGGRELLDKSLKSRGAIVHTIIAYERVLPTLTNHESKINLSSLNVIVTLSFESIKNLLKLMGEKKWSILKKIPILVPSSRIKELAHHLGFQTIWLAKNASHEAVLKTLGKGNAI